MKIIFVSLIESLSKFKKLLILIGFFILFVLYWYITNEILLLVYAFAIGESDPSTGFFTITSLQEISCDKVAEFNNSMSLITEPMETSSGHQRYIKIRPSVVSTEGMSVFQKLSLQSMSDKCFVAYGSFSK